jgi:acyl carrier protein
MADDKSLAARVARLFAERLEVEVPTPDTDLFDTGILDSLRFVELLAVLEETFGVRVAVEELEIDDFRNLSRIADFLAAKQLTPQG